MNFYKTLFAAILIAISATSFSQTRQHNYIDTAATMVWTGANFGLHFPVGKLSETFKMNFNVGTGLTVKTNTNWTISAHFNYMFGSKMRDTSRLFYESLFGKIFDRNKDIINGEAMAATVYFEGRYWNITGGVGKIIPLDRWKNSGIWVHLNFGYFSHKIHITDPDNLVDQFRDRYRKGYDRRSDGFCMSQFIGYVFMQRVRVLSFYAGIEIYETWTKPSRDYIFTEGPTSGMKNEFSALLGFKIGWIVPLYEKKRSVTLYTR